MVHVRGMGEADVEAVSGIRVRGWRAAYAGIVPQAYLDAMSVERDAAGRRELFARPGRTSRDLVAQDVDGGGPVGWLCYGPFRGEIEVAGRAGEVYALYVDPELTGRGVGRALLDAAHAAMRDEGYAASALWVLRDNHGARRFYARSGYTPDGATQDDPYDTATLTEVRYVRSLRPEPPGTPERPGTR